MLRVLGEREGKPGTLQESLAAYRLALEVFEKSGHAHAKMVECNLVRLQAALDKLTPSGK